MTSGFLISENQRKFDEQRHIGKDARGNSIQNR